MPVLRERKSGLVDVTFMSKLRSMHYTALYSTVPSQGHCKTYSIYTFHERFGPITVRSLAKVIVPPPSPSKLISNRGGCAFPDGSWHDRDDVPCILSRSLSRSVSRPCLQAYGNGLPLEEARSALTEYSGRQATQTTTVVTIWYGEEFDRLQGKNQYLLVLEVES